MIRSGRFVGIVTGLLNRIICLALALLFLVLVVKPDLVIGSGDRSGGILTLEDLSGLKVPLVVAGVLLLVLNLNVIQFILYATWNSNFRRYISSKTTSGVARVSLDAVERSLKAAARGVPEVERCRLRVYRIGGKRYKVEVQFWISDECNVLNISEKLRLILKKRFSELVAIEPDEKVFFEINLAGIRSGRRGGPFGTGGPPKDAIDASRRQFKGPVYPVGGDM